MELNPATDELPNIDKIICKINKCLNSQNVLRFDNKQ